MIGYYTLSDDGEPVLCDDIRRWGSWFRQHDRSIGRDEVDGVRISTVFLGIDHQFGDGPPILWETMVFGGPLDQEQDRYATRAAATRGHATMVARVIAAMGRATALATEIASSSETTSSGGGDRTLLEEHEDPPSGDIR